VKQSELMVARDSVRVSVALPPNHAVAYCGGRAEGVDQVEPSLRLEIKFDEPVSVQFTEGVSKAAVAALSEE
jgi:hypothetical protein